MDVVKNTYDGALDLWQVLLWPAGPVLALAFMIGVIIAVIILSISILVSSESKSRLGGALVFSGSAFLVAFSTFIAGHIISNSRESAIGDTAPVLITGLGLLLSYGLIEGKVRAHFALSVGIISVLCFFSGLTIGSFHRGNTERVNEIASLQGQLQLLEERVFLVLSSMSDNDGSNGSTASEEALASNMEKTQEAFSIIQNANPYWQAVPESGSMQPNVSFPRQPWNFLPRQPWHFDQTGMVDQSWYENLKNDACSSPSDYIDCILRYSRQD